MCKVPPCERKRPGGAVDRYDVCFSALGDVVRELALSAPDVEHPLARPDALDEEVVIPREAMFGVNAAVVLDRARIDTDVVRVCVHV